MKNYTCSQTLLDILQARNTFTLTDFCPIHVAGQPIGFVHHTYKDELVGLHPCITYTKNRIAILPNHTSYTALTQLFCDLNEALVQKGLLTPSHKGEMYRVTVNRFSEPLFEMARYAAPFWGIHIFGVHLNGLVQHKNGPIDMWYAQRSKNRPAPGKLDHLVCGGQPAGLSLLDNLCKEAHEEATMPRPLASQAIPVGMASCWEQEGHYLWRFTPFMFDLWLPEHFTPVNNDSSVSTFATMPLTTLAKQPERILKFKAACQPVLISLLLRQGYLNPDDAHYADICTLLLKGSFSDAKELH